MDAEVHEDLWDEAGYVLIILIYRSCVSTHLYRLWVAEVNAEVHEDLWDEAGYVLIILI